MRHVVFSAVLYLVALAVSCTLLAVAYEVIAPPATPQAVTVGHAGTPAVEPSLPLGVQIAGLLAVLCTLILILASCTGIREVLVALFLVVVLGFYYAPTVQAIILHVPRTVAVLEESASHSLGSERIRPYCDEAARLVQSGRESVLDRLPGFEGWSIGRLRLLPIAIDKDFVPTVWPAVMLFLGLVVRSVILRFVPNERLKEVAQEYWLFIAGYVILAFVASSLIHWNVFVLLVVLSLTIFILATGALRIVADFVRGSITAGVAMVDWLRVGLRYLAVAAARVARVLRRVFRFIRHLYETYIIGPLKRFYYWTEKKREFFHAKAESWLRELKLDDEE